MGLGAHSAPARSGAGRRGPASDEPGCGAAPRQDCTGRIRMANVAFIGPGLLGSGMVEGMLRRGDAVTVWNRTESKARALEQFGARVAATPADAVAGADRVHMTLPDDDVVESVTTGF